MQEPQRPLSTQRKSVSLRSMRTLRLNVVSRSCFRGLGWVAACVLWLSPTVFAATKAIRAGKAIDPNGKVIVNAVIVVDNDRIMSIGPGAPPAGLDVIHLTRYTVIPGMNDAHTHLTYFWDGTPGR